MGRCSAPLSLFTAQHSKKNLHSAPSPVPAHVPGNLPPYNTDFHTSVPTVPHGKRKRYTRRCGQITCRFHKRCPRCKTWHKNILMLLQMPSLQEIKRNPPCRGYRFTSVIGCCDISPNPPTCCLLITCLTTARTAVILLVTTSKPCLRQTCCPCLADRLIARHFADVSHRTHQRCQHKLRMRCQRLGC